MRPSSNVSAPHSNGDLQAAIWRDVSSRLLRWSGSFRRTAVSATLAGLPLARRAIMAVAMVLVLPVPGKPKTSA